MITKPTLVWKLATEKVGKPLIEVAYQTGGINWQADYNAVLNPNDTKLDLGGWVTIDNQSGATYKDAKLKLIAGDVRKVQPYTVTGAVGAYRALAAAPAAGFEEKAFFEYHLYTLGRPGDGGAEPDQQIELSRRRMFREEDFSV